MVRLIIHEDKLLQVKDKKPNPGKNSTAFVFRQDLTTQGVVPLKINNVFMQCDLPYNINFDILDFIFVMGDLEGDVQFYRPYIKMPVVNLDSEVFEGIPNRMTAEVWDYTDEENPVLIEPSRVKTWREWVQPNFTIQEIEGEAYFLSNAGTVSGVTLSGSELMIIYNESYSELVDVLPVIDD